MAGGDGQEQAALNLLVDHIDFGMLPAEAVTAPRFATTHHEDSFDPNPNRQKTFGTPGSMILNDNVGGVRDDLAGRGHHVEVVDTPLATPVMLHIDGETGVISAAGDPAARRHAAGVGS